MNKQILFLILLITSTLVLFNNKRSNINQLIINQQTFTLYKNQFENWKSQFTIKFQSNQQTYRLLIFIQNNIKIKQHNEKPNQTYKLGLNQFAHLNQLQFIQLFFKNQINRKSLKTQSNQQNQSKQQIFGDVDWQVLGKVSDVKNQGTCDAGYAFSTTSLIQSSLMIQNQNISLSQQQIIDCSENYTTMGCNGGSRIGTLNFAKEKGLVTEKSYPYTGNKGTCKKEQGEFKISFKILQSNGCQQIKANLYKTPMTVAVNAKNWQLYKAGIFNNCPQTDQVNHDIYLVGVSLTYWRLKNSWGVRWGQYGYIRLNLGNTCGICSKTGYGFIL